MTITPIRPQIERDRFDRPLVHPPVGGGKPVPYTRCTTFVGALEDMYNLSKWQQRHAVRGLAAHHDLLTAVRNQDPNDKRGLDVLVDEAKDRSGAGDAARMGSYLHAVTEAADRGQDPALVPRPRQSTGPVAPGAYAADLAAYQAATSDLTAVHIEEFTVLDHFKIGGTPDRVVSYQGKRYIADLKTGSIEHGFLKIAAQLAVYARSQLYDVETYQRSPHDADLDRGIVIHLPAGSGTCRLYWVDLQAGWEAVKVAARVREKRATKFRDVMEPITSTDEAPAPVAPPASQGGPLPLAQQIAACTTPDEVRALWAEHAAVWDDRLTETAKQHIAALASK